MIGEKILVVDDNQDFLEELDEILDCCGYCATVVSDSMVAVDTARSLSPDLILLDLKMNGINGLQVVDQLKGSEDTACIPIICMSGHFPVDQRGSLMDTGNIEAWMKKPFGVLELIKEIETALAASRSLSGKGNDG